MNARRGILIVLAFMVSAAAVAVLTWGGLPTALGGGEEYAQQQEICHDEFGEEWEAAGIAKHEDWTHYHIKCERKTGLIGVEERWVSVPAEEIDA